MVRELDWLRSRVSGAIADLGDDGALESRKAIMRRLVDRDIERIAEKIQQLTQLECCIQVNLSYFVG